MERSFQQDGVTYNVSTQVSVQVAGSQADAAKSGAQNVIGLSNGPADPAHNANALTGPGTSLGNFLRGQDVGIWNYNTLGADSRNTAAHEFAHQLGIDDHEGHVLSNTHPTGRPIRATDSDFRWGIREAVNSVNLGRDMMSWGPCSGWQCASVTVPSNPHMYTIEKVGAPLVGWRK